MTGRVRVGRALLVAGLVVGLSGCAGSGLTPAGQLQDGLAAVVDAANAQNLSALRSAITDLRATVRSERDAQQISAAKAAQILTALAAVETDSALLTAVPASPTPVVTTPPPSPTPVVTTPPPTTPPPTSPPPTSPPPSPTPIPTPTVAPTEAPVVTPPPVATPAGNLGKSKNP